LAPSPSDPTPEAAVNTGLVAGLSVAGVAVVCCAGYWIVARRRDEEEETPARGGSSRARSSSSGGRGPTSRGKGQRV